MGTFTVDIEIGDPQGEHWERIVATVDTGSLYSVAPRPMLEQLGVQPYRRGRFAAADGRIFEEDIGQTWIHVAGRSGVRLVMFGNGRDGILGSDTLNGLQLELNETGTDLVEKISLRPTRILVGVAPCKR